MVKTGAGPFYPRWTLRDRVAATVLFAATAGMVWWQNAHVAVLWDLGYVLDSAQRIAAGQVPYRDFPFAHAPLTFLIQAAILRFTGRVFFYHIFYTAVVGGLSTMLTWRIALKLLQGRVKAAWSVALLLTAPLSVLGIYCIIPNPEYDCDCAFWILAAIWLLLGIDTEETKLGRGFAAGVLACVPLFFKQNMGLLFLAPVAGAVALALAAKWFGRGDASAERIESSTLLAVIGGATAALLTAALILHWTAGIENYLHWTIQFAAQRRLPGFRDVLGVYRDPSLLWTLPCVAVGLVLTGTRLGKRLWAQIAAFGLLAAPFLLTLASLLIYDDADERGDSLLSLWPLLLLLAVVLALANLLRFRNQLNLCRLLPLILFIAINGTFLSQQLWGSTYAIWPLLTLLLAEMLAFLDGLTARTGASRWFVPGLSSLISVTLLVCGGFYTASEERLSYAQLPDGPAVHSAFPHLAGMATPGPYLPEFDELLRYAESNIPFNDGLILLPGEEPFWFASGRVPRFPITLFDPATDPYSPSEIASLVRSREIRWLIVKRDLQLREDPTPERAATMNALMGEFKLTARLGGYDVYRR